MPNSKENHWVTGDTLYRRNCQAPPHTLKGSLPSRSAPDSPSLDGYHLALYVGLGERHSVRLLGVQRYRVDNLPLIMASHHEPTFGVTFYLFKTACHRTHLLSLLPPIPLRQSLFLSLLYEQLMDASTRDQAAREASLLLPAEICLIYQSVDRDEGSDTRLISSLYSRSRYFSSNCVNFNTLLTRNKAPGVN